MCPTLLCVSLDSSFLKPIPHGVRGWIPNRAPVEAGPGVGVMGVMVIRES